MVWNQYYCILKTLYLWKLCLKNYKVQHCLYYTVLNSIVCKCNIQVHPKDFFQSLYLCPFACSMCMYGDHWTVEGGVPVRGTRLEATPIVKQLSDAKSVCARLVQCGPVWSEGVGEVNQTVEQTEAVANLSPHLGGYVGIVFTGDFVYQLFYLRTLSIYLLLIFLWILVKHFFFSARVRLERTELRVNLCKALSGW